MHTASKFDVEPEQAHVISFASTVDPPVADRGLWGLFSDCLSAG